jgi:hypothetical protein
MEFTMKIKRSLQQWKSSFALIILLLAFLACRTSSNEVIPTFDPNLIQTAIAGTSAAAQFQTLTANPTLTFTPVSTSTSTLTLTPTPSLTPTPIELTDSLDSKCLSIDKKVALDQIFDESYFDGMITDVQGVCDQTSEIFQDLNAAKTYEVYFKIQSKSQESSGGIFWIGEFRNNDINYKFDSFQEASPLKRQEISDLGNRANYTCSRGLFGVGTVDSYRIQLDSYLIYLFFFPNKDTEWCNIDTYLPGIRAMISDFRK